MAKQFAKISQCTAQIGRARHRLSPRRYARAAVRFGVACGVGVAASAAMVAPAYAQTIDPPVPQPVVADADGTTLAALVNDYRVTNGLNPLVIDATFSASTAPHALLLSTLNPAPEPPAGYAFWCPEATPSTFYHDNNANQLASAPSGSVSYGENIAYRCSPSFNTHAGDIMDGWRNSPGHNDNMLNPAWTHIASVAVRWNNTTIAVHRFASVPGTTPPPVAVAQTPAAAAPAEDDGARILDAPADSATTDSTSTDSATADSAPTSPAPTSDDTAPEAPANNATSADPGASAEAATSAAPSTESDAGAAPGEAAVPQLAFTGTNLNLALFGLALIAAGLSVLALPSVRNLDEETAPRS